MEDDWKSDSVMTQFLQLNDAMDSTVRSISLSFLYAIVFDLLKDC